MKRYYNIDGQMIEEQFCTQEWNNTRAGWAGYAEAEAEIEKARKEGIKWSNSWSGEG